MTRPSSGWVSILRYPKSTWHSISESLLTCVVSDSEIFMPDTAQLGSEPMQRPVRHRIALTGNQHFDFRDRQRPAPTVARYPRGDLLSMGINCSHDAP